MMDVKIFFDSMCQSCFAENNKFVSEDHKFYNGRLKINIAYETSIVLVSWKQVSLFEPIFLYYVTTLHEIKVMIL
jgi:hypothetical protein